MSHWTYKCPQCDRFFDSTTQAKPNEDKLCGECSLHNLHQAAPDLLEALEAMQIVFRNLRGRAFVGSRIPREQEPLLQQANIVDAAATAAIAKANGSEP